jgi:hypothetical protein
MNTKDREIGSARWHGVEHVERSGDTIEGNLDEPGPGRVKADEV